MFQQSNLVFGALEVVDDEDLGLLVATATNLQGVVRCVELYVESIPVEVENPVEVPGLQENQAPVEEENPEVDTQRLADPSTQWDTHPVQMTPQSDPHCSQWGSQRSQTPPQHDPQPSQRLEYHDYFSESHGQLESQWNQMPPQSDRSSVSGDHIGARCLRSICPSIDRVSHIMTVKYFHIMYRNAIRMMTHSQVRHWYLKPCSGTGTRAVVSLIGYHVK